MRKENADSKYDHSRLQRYAVHWDYYRFRPTVYTAFITSESSLNYLEQRTQVPEDSGTESIAELLCEPVCRSNIFSHAI